MIIPMEHAMGTGWAFTLIGALYLVLSPMLWVVMRWGPQWREQRRVKDEERRRHKEERDRGEEKV